MALTQRHMLRGPAREVWLNTISKSGGIRSE
eukprot:SAG31_NODE_743_length_12418_cov_3.780908_17_plen_30_part_01